MKYPIFFFFLPMVVFGQFLDRPNVVLFMADDMGMGDSSAYQFFTKNSDVQQVHTPAMQKLANMGMLFTDAHTPSSRCTPTLRITYGQISVESPHETLGTIWCTGRSIN